MWVYQFPDTPTCAVVKTYALMVSYGHPSLMGILSIGTCVWVKLKTWGTTDVSLFLVLTRINHLFFGVPNVDPEPHKYHETYTIHTH